jgi:hypothetical protein
LLANFHDKLNGIAACAAAKAVVELLGGANAKTGRLIIMEGTQPRKILTSLPQHNMLRDDIHNVNALLDLLNGVGVKVGNAHSRLK